MLGSHQNAVAYQLNLFLPISFLLIMYQYMSLISNKVIFHRKYSMFRFYHMCWPKFVVFIHHPSLY